MQTSRSNAWWLWLLRVSWFAPPFFLVTAAVPHLLSGFALESAFPVPTYLSMDVSLPKRAYKSAATRLEHINPADGDAKIAAAQADQYAGGRIRASMATLEQGLSGSPSSARGWMVLAELRAHDDPSGAGQALTLSFQLDRREYWFSGRRARDAAKLWGALTNEGKKEALEQVRLLWTEPVLRSQLEPLIASDGGKEIIVLAFEGDREALRALNRWRASVRRSKTDNSEHG